MADASQGSGAPSISTPETALDRAPARPPFRGGAPIRGAALSVPVEIQFLAQHGVSADRLLRAVAAAPRGVEPLDAVLAEGVIDEETYYHALAQHLGCAYYVGEPPFAGHFDAVKSLRCGIAPLAERGGGPRAVIAPRAQSVASLIE